MHDAKRSSNPEGPVGEKTHEKFHANYGNVEMKRISN